MNSAYHLKKIRALLMEGFSDAELRRFSFEEVDFRSVYHRLSQRSGKEDIVDELLEYAERKLLMEKLLIWAKERSPTRYDQYQPYYDDTSLAVSTFSNGLAKDLAIDIESPQGTMRPDSRFYIERTADRDCWHYLTASHAVTLYVQAPRQMGKSSLMRRMIHRAGKELKQRTAFVDFQELPKQYFTDSDEKDFLIELCLIIGHTLGVEEAIDRYWRGRNTNIIKCGLYLSQHIVPALNEPFILAMDEVDRLLPSPFRDNFFGMLRVWHNKRAYEESFRQVSLFLSSSTEASLLIANQDQSPFNVAEHIFPEDFTQAEVEELNRRHGAPLSQNQVDDLMGLIAGHPFLTRVALYQVVTGNASVSELFDRATEESGPFGDHLRYYLLKVLKKPGLQQALTEVYSTHSLEESQAFHYLKGLGLIKKQGRQVVFRNHLCELYFKYNLNRRSR